jgi:hypothetical protein
MWVGGRGRQARAVGGKVDGQPGGAVWLAAAGRVKSERALRRGGVCALLLWRTGSESQSEEMVACSFVRQIVVMSKNGMYYGEQKKIK